jgi:Tfp pilus assembly protein PilO
MDYLLNLWNTKRWLFWVLIPLVIIAFGLKIFMGGQAEKGAEDIKKAEDKDRELAKQQAEANGKADALKAQADQVGNQADKPNTDVEWYKK